MRGRLASLTLLALPVLLLAVPGQVRAHGLMAKYQVLPGGQVRIESWFAPTKDPAKGTAVHVYGSDKQLLVSGRLDEHGVFIFSVSRAERLRVVVSDGEGHRKELHIAARALAPALGIAAADIPADSPEEPESASSDPSHADRTSQTTWRDVLLGVGFVLALAAFVLSVRNARRLRGLGPGPRKGE